MKTTWIITTASAIMALLLSAGGASAQGLVVETGNGAVNTEGVLINKFEADFGNRALGWPMDVNGFNGGDFANAVANCQLLLGLDTFVLNFAAIDSLGLFLGGIRESPIGATGSKGGEEGRGWKTGPVGAEDSCEQQMGAIYIVHETTDGWGEPATHNDLPALAGSWAGGGPSTAGVKNGNGNGDLFGGGHSSVEYVLANTHSAYFGGGATANAVANCQILIGWNTAVVNIGLLGGGDLFGRDPGEELPPIIVAKDGAQTEGKGEWTWEQPEGPGGKATCKQTVESVTILVGDNIPRLPPES